MPHFLASISSSSSLGMAWFLHPLCVIQFIHTFSICFFSLHSGWWRPQRSWWASPDQRLPLQGGFETHRPTLGKGTLLFHDLFPFTGRYIRLSLSIIGTHVARYSCRSAKTWAMWSDGVLGRLLNMGLLIVYWGHLESCLMSDAPWKDSNGGLA